MRETLRRPLRRRVTLGVCGSGEASHATQLECGLTGKLLADGTAEHRPFRGFEQRPKAPGWQWSRWMGGSGEWERNETARNARARGDRTDGDQSRDTAPWPPMSITFSLAPVGQSLFGVPTSALCAFQTYHFYYARNRKERSAALHLLFLCGASARKPVATAAEPMRTRRCDPPGESSSHKTLTPLLGACVRSRGGQRACFLGLVSWELHLVGPSEPSPCLTKTRGLICHLAPKIPIWKKSLCGSPPFAEVS